MVQNLSADCTAHSPSDGPIWGQWWWQETMCRGRWSPRGSIRFQSSPLDHCSTADQRTLAQLGLHPCIFNWHVGIYDAGSIQGFRKAETMTGKEQMPHIKVSGDCFHASKGGGQFFYLHQFTCFQLSQFWGTSTKLPRVQPERMSRVTFSLLRPPSHPPECTLLPSWGCLESLPSFTLAGGSGFLSHHWMEIIETSLKRYPSDSPVQLINKAIL